jgi:hypothetical protein
MEQSSELSAYFDDPDSDIGTLTVLPTVQVEDDVFADRMLYRLAVIYAERARVRKLCADRMADIEIWRDMRVAKADREALWIEQNLEAFARNRVARGGPKTLSLPSGDLKLVKPLESVDVRDPDGFRAWAIDNNPDLLRYPDPPMPEPRKAELKKLKAGEARPFGDLLEFNLVSDGEVIPGAFVVVGKEDHFKAIPTARES